MSQEKLTDIVNEIKSNYELKEWKFQLKVEGIYEFFREKRGVCKARLYMEVEENKFGYAYIVLNPLNKTIENGKGHCIEMLEIKEKVLETIIHLNREYFTESSDQGHNAPTQQSNS